MPENGPSVTVVKPAEEAHLAHEAIVQGIRRANEGLAQAAAGCWELKQSNGWLALGDGSLNAYLARPDVTLTRTDFYRLADIWDTYVLNGGLDVSLLADAGHTKLEVALPALKAGLVTAEQAVSDATVLTRVDLKEKYGSLVTEAAKDGAPRWLVQELDAALRAATRDLEYDPKRQQQINDALAHASQWLLVQT